MKPNQLFQTTVTCILFSLIFQTSSFAQDVFVSPSGDDNNNGTSSGTPVQSFQKAADVAKSLGATGITVEFADGLYLFDASVVLDATYSGITFEAAEGAEPVFSSLKQVTGWSVHSGNIMVADLPAGLSHIRYLQDDKSDWLERSATESFRTTELAGGDDGGCVECNNYTPATQTDMSNIQIPAGFSNPDWTYVNQYDLRANTLPWHLDILPIASYNVGENRLYTSVPGLYDLRKDAAEVLPTAWILNSLEGIDTPGEWACLNGKIYLYPLTDTAEIYAPALTELIRLDDGSVDGNAAVSTPVQDIVFDGISFTGGEYRPIQSDDVTGQHDWMVIDEPDALLRLKNTANITVTNCSFYKSGGTGLRIDRYGQNITVHNNVFSFLGRGGINIGGRGPGYGDVSHSNTISYNFLEHIGMESWASVAIMLDNSSNNYVHHNYIENTYFTAIAAVGPRQLMFAAWGEGADDFYVGREFHFWEIEPSIPTFIDDNGGVVEGSREAMRFVYNYDNRIEENALIDVSTGKDILINGQIYISGAQRSLSANDIKTNYVERNYLYDSYNHSINDYAIYSDSDQDDCNYIGNMIHGVQNGDEQYEMAPIILVFNQWAESETEGMGQITLQSNLSENVTHCDDTECGHTIGIDYVETDPIQNGIGGSDTYLSTYERMYTAICDENFPQIDSLPGAQAVRDRLNTLITSFGGTLPDCEAISATEEVVKQHQLTVFPNPNYDGGIFIQLGDRLSGYIDIQLVNLMGQTVQTFSKLNVSGTNVLHIQLRSDTTPGPYYLLVKENNVPITTTSIVLE